VSGARYRVTEDLDVLLGRVRQLTMAYMAGGVGSFRAFRDLVQLLLGITVLADGQYVRLVQQTGRQEVRALGGPTGPTSAVRLRNGHWLRVAVDLYLAEHEGTTRLEVRKSSFQYQADQDGQREVFASTTCVNPGTPRIRRLTSTCMAPSMSSARYLLGLPSPECISRPTGPRWRR